MMKNLIITYRNSIKTNNILSFIVALFILFSMQVNAQNITMTNGGNNDACGGTFSDPGGAGNYSGGNNTYVHTICSSTPGEFPKVDFTSFSLFSSSSICSSSGDKLEVFDGPNVGSPSLGTFTGTNTPGQSFYGSTGCLTFRFTTIASHSSGFLCMGNTNNPGAPGWSATITCVNEIPPSGNNCPESIPFCSDQNYNFPNATLGTAPTSPDYGCLGTQPNPIWYFMKIANSGPMQLDLAEYDNNGNGIDIDFAMWGPFTDLPSGCTQIMGGNLSPLQCSYSTSSTETIGLGLPGGDQNQGPFSTGGGSTPPDAQAGEYYILLLTNYDGAQGYVTLEQTAGTGQTDCSIINPCSISNFTANISACSNDLYTVNGVIEVTEPPATGDLIVVDCNGNQTVVASAPFTASTYNYTLSNLDADGNACSVEAYFSDETSCSSTINYNAPICTPNPCNFDLLDISIQSCNGNNTFDITGTIEFSNPPTTGQLVIEDCNGNSDTYNAPFTSPQTFSIPNINADGAACNITATFSADPGCNIDISYTNVSDCSCSANIGTFNVTTDGTKNGHDITLCEGQSFTFLTNGDYTPPDELTDPSITYDPGIWWAVYSCPPTVGTTPSATEDIVNDPCLVTFLNATNITDLNDMSFINSFPPGTFTDNTVYFAPITIYSMVEGYYSFSNSGVPCYQMGTPYAVQYLPEIIKTETSDCQAGTVSITVSGGSPAINGTNFTGTNLTPSSASFDNSSVANNGTIVVSGLLDGDSYSFDIEDEFGCLVNISGTFVGVSASDFTYAQAQYCQDGTNPTPTINGGSGGAFTAAPNSISIDGSTGVINLGSSTPGDYTITYTSTGTPCNSTTDFDLTINPLPTFTLATIDPTCGNNDGSITIEGLDASSSYDLTYVANGTTVGPQNLTTNATGEIELANLNFGNYTDFEITNSGGCSAVNATGTALNEIGAPPVTAPNDIDICLGESATLSAINPDGATISWDNGINDGVAFTPSSAGSTTYIVTATNSTGCTATDQVMVNVHASPTVSAGTDQIICQGASATLTATGATTYNWDVLGGGATQTVSPAATTTYEVTGSDTYGCTNTDQVEVTINPQPVPEFEGNRLKGCEPFTVQFTNLTQPSGGNCKWDFGDGSTSTLCDNVIHTYQAGGTYSVTLTITDAIGCSGTHTEQDYIEVMSKPEAIFTADPMITGTSQPEITFTNGTHNATDFTWIFGDGSPMEFTYDATHTYPDDKGDNYIVTLIASNGPNCDDTVKAVIKIDEELIFYIPNSFTPDADDFNETFKPIFTSGFDPQTYTLSIYDRWGEIIFESHDTNVGWKGTYGENSSTIVKQGTYVWKIEIKETGKDKRNSYTGHVTLLK